MIVSVEHTMHNVSYETYLQSLQYQPSAAAWAALLPIMPCQAHAGEPPKASRFVAARKIESERKGVCKLLSEAWVIDSSAMQFVWFGKSREAPSGLQSAVINRVVMQKVPFRCAR